MITAIIIFLLSVSGAVCQCPPSSGIYLMHNGDCYPNGSYFYENNLKGVSNSLMCMLPGVNLDGGQWVAPNGSTHLLQTNVRCSPSSLSVYIPIGDNVSVSDDGWYKCCLPTSCSGPNTSIITANIFRWAQIADIRVDLPLDITILPQVYTLHAIKIGHHNQYYLHNAIWYYETDSSSTELTTSLCSSHSRYSCTVGNGVLLHSSNGTYDYTLTVTWNGEIITSGVLSQSNNNGDHDYRFYLNFGHVVRNRTCSIAVPKSAPSSLTVINKTATTITINWTALDSSDADGYVVNVTSNNGTVQTVQVKKSSQNIIILRELRIGTTYNITVRAYQQLLGPASNIISVHLHCQLQGIYLIHNGECYPNGSYFWNNKLRSISNSLTCVLPGSIFATGQWVRVDGDDPVDCFSNNDNDPFRCNNKNLPDATLSLYLGQELPTDQEGFYKCCLPTSCSDPSTSIITANIFKFVQIVSFTFDVSTHMTVFPQEYALHCVTTGYRAYNFSLNIDGTVVNSGTCCTPESPCAGSQMLYSSNNTYDHIINIIWDGETISSGLFNQLSTGNQNYQCMLEVTNQTLKTNNMTIKVPGAAPSSITVVNKTASTITVKWSVIDSSDADGYVVNVTNNSTGTAQTIQVEGSSQNVLMLTGLNGGGIYGITVRAYQQLLGPASSVINVQTLNCTGIFLMHGGHCYPNGSYFFDYDVRGENNSIKCVLPGSTLNGGEWVSPVGSPINCGEDPLRCNIVHSPSILSLYISTAISTSEDGLYKCCLPNDCSDPSTNIITATIFRHVQIASFTVELPSDMTVYPQRYSLHCTKTGYPFGYDFFLNFSGIEVKRASGCTPLSHCDRQLIHNSNNTYDHIVNMTWDTVTITSGSFSHAYTGDQHYQCILYVIGHVNRTRDVTLKVPDSAPTSLNIISKTGTTVTVSWTALDSSDADGYVVNVTSDTVTVQTIQLVGSSNTTIMLKGLTRGTTYNVTVRAYQQLLGPASNPISVETCSGPYLVHKGECYPNGSYFFDLDIKGEGNSIACEFPNSTLNGGEWITPSGSSVNCNNDPLRCSVISSPPALSLYISTAIMSSDDGIYKCCLPTVCSDPNTNIVTANIFRYVQIPSLTVDLPTDMTVFPQEFTLHCIKTGYADDYSFYMSVDSRPLNSATGCNARSPCIGSHLLHSSNHTYDHTVIVMWDAVTVSSGQVSQSITGDQHYQCRLEVGGQPNRIHDLTVKVPRSAPSLTVIRKTVTTVTIRWAPLNLSEANGYVINVTRNAETVQIIKLIGNDNSTIVVKDLIKGTAYSIIVRAYKQLLGPASTMIVETLNCSGISLMHSGECYPNGSFFFNMRLSTENKLMCVLPDSTLNDGEWVAPNGSLVDCNTGHLHCSIESSPAIISLYADGYFEPSGDGWYKCCLPTNCSDPSTSIITANIFRWANIVEISVDLPSDITVLPQTYTLHAIKTGDNAHSSYLISADWYYESGNSSTKLATSLCSGQYGYSCTVGNGALLHSSNGTYDYTLTVTWNGENVTSGILSQSNNNGDHVYRFYLNYGYTGNSVQRNQHSRVKVPGSAPTSINVINKTISTITINWTALDSSDADGYVVNVTSDTETVQTLKFSGSSYTTVTLEGLRGGISYKITVRAYQHLLGYESRAIRIQTLPVIYSINWALVSSLAQINDIQYRIDCLTNHDMNSSTDVYWLVNGVMENNSTYALIDDLTYNNTILVYPDPLGVSVNVTCIAMNGGVNYSQSVILQAPNNFPNHVKGFILNATIVKVNWTTSSKTNGYVIEYTTGGVIRNVVSTIENEIILTDLSPKSTYTISVYSYIDLLSVNSTVTVLKFDVPSPVTSLSVSNVSATDITVNWTSPSSKDGNYVTYYTISYTPSCSELSSMNDIVSVAPHQSITTYSYTLRGLYSGMNYTITVRAGNVLGESNLAMIFLGTLPSVPTGTPKSPYVDLMANKITWNEVNCSQLNGAFVEYIVLFSGSFINLSSTLIANELEFDTVYNVSVAVVNSIGRGPFSDPVIVEFDEGKTPAVTSITSCSTFVDTLIGTSVSLFVVLALLTFSIIINIYCFIRLRHFNTSVNLTQAKFYSRPDRDITKQVCSETKDSNETEELDERIYEELETVHAKEDVIEHMYM